MKMKGHENPLKVLLVEDDDVHALLVRRSLEGGPQTPQVFRVANGVDALAYLRRQAPYEDAPVPDVVFLDLRLPKVNGHEVLSAIKQDEHLRAIPVIIMTTSRDETDRAKAYRQHANSYVVKPADFQEFRRIVKDVSHYWGVCNERQMV